MSTHADAAVRDRLIGELSDLALRIVDSGGPGALAACAAALVEGAAAAMPGKVIPEFCKALLEAVASGARMAGHTVEVCGMGESKRPGGLH